MEKGLNVQKQVNIKHVNETTAWKNMWLKNPYSRYFCLCVCWVLCWRFFNSHGPCLDCSAGLQHIFLLRFFLGYDTSKQRKSSDVSCMEGPKVTPNPKPSFFGFRSTFVSCVDPECLVEIPRRKPSLEEPIIRILERVSCTICLFPGRAHLSLKW